MSTRCKICDATMTPKVLKSGKLNEYCQNCEADVKEVCQEYRDYFHWKDENDGRRIRSS